MSIKLHPHWPKILLRAWSIRFDLLAIGSECLSVAFPYFEGYLPIPQWTFGLLAGGFAGLAIYSRLIPQKNLKP